VGGKERFSYISCTLRLSVVVGCAYRKRAPKKEHGLLKQKKTAQELHGTQGTQASTEVFLHGMCAVVRGICVFG